MIPILFLLGRPGSGKSTAARYIRSFGQKMRWDVTHIQDYAILYEMFLADIAQRRFRPAAHGGFDVVDFSVLDEVLVDVQRALKRRSPITENELVIVEFARDDYGKAFQLFDTKLLRNAYFLFVEADIEICIQRIHERIKEPGLANHFISDELVRGYYGKDKLPYMKGGIQKEFGIDPHRVKVVDNNGSEEQFMLEVDQSIECILPGTLAIVGK